MDKETKKKLRLAKQNEAYHRKQMEYYREEIDILKEVKKENGTS